MSTLAALFGEEDPNEIEGEYFEVLPISVLDIGKQESRTKGTHDTKSSRAEYSPFPKEVATTCYEFYLKDATKVVDPFAGWGERGYYAKQFEKEYVGYDISPKAIKNAKAKYGVNNILCDSFDADVPEFDGFITCPPYWNLEKYEGKNNLSRLDTWEDFLMDYEVIIQKFYKAAKVGATFCIMVGDWRSDGNYFDLEHETCRIFKECGAVVRDKVIVSRKNVSKIKIMLPQAKRLGYSVKVHEYLLIFQKDK